MKKKLVVGILREEKLGERRAPLTPKDVRWLVKEGVKVEVESDELRVFSDSQYRSAGARIVQQFKEASLLIGIKEPRIDNLYDKSVYMLFSHTIKGQSKNMPLLKSFLKKKCTLLDYEKITDNFDNRLVYFGRFAGICGAVDSLHYFGQKLEWEGVKNPFTMIESAHDYNSLKAAKAAVKKVGAHIRRRGLPRRLTPFIIGITGHGSVSRGAQEILEGLHPIEVHPKDMRRFFCHQRGVRKEIYKIVFLREEKLCSKSGGGFYYEDYLKKPKNYESNLGVYLPYLNILLHASYWDEKYPRMVTEKIIKKLYRKRSFRLKFIGDLSCDVGGGIELTYRTTDLRNATYTYDPKAKAYIDGCRAKGISILAVDNLPNEMPKDASEEFSAMIRDYVHKIALAGAKDLTNRPSLPKELKGAVITQGGKLTKQYKYLRKYLK